MFNGEKLRTEAENYGIELNGVMIERFCIYADELVKTNRLYNLTSVTDEDGIIVKHFIDSLCALKYINLNDGDKIIDVGCGAGFPSLPLLIARGGKIDVTFLDSNQKKLSFIENVLNKCSLEGETVHERAEALANDEKYRERYDFAVARAVAPLNILSELCIPFVKRGGFFCALKGSKDETKGAMGAIGTLGGEIQANVSYKLPNGDARSIVIIKKISQTPPKYPRKYKKITVSPL